MADRLSALDATFLELEDDDDAAHMHIGGAMVFEARPDGPPTREEVRDDLAARLDALPRYRLRLEPPQPGRFTWPSWVEDEAFDVDAHVRRAVLPAPGGDAELLDWISDFYSHRLDRHRPLWEMTLLEGLDGGRWALVWKTHHCLVDGVGSVDVAHLLLDESPEGSPRPSAAPAPTGAPEDVLHDWLPGPPEALRQVAAAGLKGARAGVRGILHPRDALKRSAALADLLIRDEMVAAPGSSLNQRIGATRRVEVVRADLADVQAIRHALSGKLNDVALAAVTGGLRRLLLSRGEEPPLQGLRAMVPVNLRHEDVDGHFGNRIASLFANLPVAEPDPLMRYEKIVDETRRLKTGHQLMGASALLDVNELTPPVVHATLARALFATRLFNVTVTNVPGPRQPLYAAGARMLDVIPIVPIAAEHALGVAIFSYADHLTFGIAVDRESVPDVDVFADGLAESIAELRAMVHAPA